MVVMGFKVLFRSSLKPMWPDAVPDSVTSAENLKLSEVSQSYSAHRHKKKSPTMAPKCPKSVSEPFNLRLLSLAVAQIPKPQSVFRALALRDS